MAKKCKCPEPESGGNFLATYADLITLLMAFFVLLFAMSTLDEVKFVTLLKGLEDAFGNSSLQNGLLEGGESIIGANLADGSAIPVPGGSLILQDLSIMERDDATDGDEGTGNRGDDDGDDPGGLGPADQFLDAEELEDVQQALAQALNDANLRESVNFRFNERGLVIAIATDDLLFGSASADLREEAAGVLAVVAAELTGFDNTVFVDGHTDDIPFGSEDYTNLDLSAERAIAVAKYLSAEFDIEPERLVPGAYGEWRPLVPNDSDENRATNRRVELVISAGGTFGPDVGADGPLEAETSPPDTGSPDADAPTAETPEIVVPEGSAPDPSSPAVEVPMEGVDGSTDTPVAAEDG